VRLFPYTLSYLCSKRASESAQVWQDVTKFILEFFHGFTLSFADRFIEGDHEEVLQHFGFVCLKQFAADQNILDLLVSIDLHLYGPIIGCMFYHNRGEFLLEFPLPLLHIPEHLEHMI